MPVTNPTTLDEIYNYITEVDLGGVGSSDNTLGKLLLAMGAAIKATGGGGLGQVTVSPLGLANGGTSTNQGADYGPDTPGTTSSGFQEALTAICLTGGEMLLLQEPNNAFNLGSTLITGTTNYPITIRGEVRGRMETGGVNEALGVFLMVDKMPASEWFLTINTSQYNLGNCTLKDFTVRGQPLNYAPNGPNEPPGTVGSKNGGWGINFAGLTEGLCPSQLYLDNLNFEFVTNPINMDNFQDGPIYIGLMVFVYCDGAATGAGYDSALIVLNCATASIARIEAYNNNNAVALVGIAGEGQYSMVNVDALYCSGGTIFNHGMGNIAPNAYLNVNQLWNQNIVTNAVLVRLNVPNASAGPANLTAHFGQVVWGGVGSGSDGNMLGGTGNSSPGFVQMTIDNFYGGSPGLWINNNYGGSAQTIGAGSFLRVLNATLTANSNLPDSTAPFANMYADIYENGTSNYRNERIPGTTLARVQYAPSSVDTSSTVVSSTGLTSVYFATGHDQAITFVAPYTGDVIFRMQAFVKGGAAAASSTVFGVVSTTQATSPGTVVGVLGLANLTPTGTAADNGQVCIMEQLITGLTAGTSYTWYGAAMYSGTATTILAQGTTSQTTVPTGAPYVLEVIAA